MCMCVCVCVCVCVCELPDSWWQAEMSDQDGDIKLICLSHGVKQNNKAFSEFFFFPEPMNDFASQTVGVILDDALICHCVILEKQIRHYLFPECLRAPQSVLAHSAQLDISVTLVIVSLKLVWAVRSVLYVCSGKRASCEPRCWLLRCTDPDQHPSEQLASRGTEPTVLTATACILNSSTIKTDSELRAKQYKGESNFQIPALLYCHLSHASKLIAFCWHQHPQQ
ncbi:hypothetical protein INR49_010877 [Caranx melampygus]|nr:hypothetical protein INR49_010877 [Caranx melampygus]